jgi:translation elongation factor EF-Tu-like GTPase
MTWPTFLRYMTPNQCGDLRGHVPHGQRTIVLAQLATMYKHRGSKQLPGERITSNGHRDARGITQEWGK